MAGDERHTLQSRLSDEQPVERVSVVKRKQFHQADVSECDGQQMEAVDFTLVNHEPLGR